MSDIIRFTITVDEGLWTRLSQRADKLRMTKRAAYEQAIEQWLIVAKGPGPQWQTLPDMMGHIIENALAEEQILERNDGYLLALVVREGDGAEASLYKWVNGYPPELATGTTEAIRRLAEDEILGWDQDAAAQQVRALQRLRAVIG